MVCYMVAGVPLKGMRVSEEGYGYGPQLEANGCHDVLCLLRGIRMSKMDPKNRLICQFAFGCRSVCDIRLSREQVRET